MKDASEKQSPRSRGATLFNSLIKWTIGVYLKLFLLYPSFSKSGVSAIKPSLSHFKWSHVISFLLSGHFVDRMDDDAVETNTGVVNFALGGRLADPAKYNWRALFNPFAYIMVALTAVALVLFYTVDKLSDWVAQFANWFPPMRWLMYMPRMFYYGMSLLYYNLTTHNDSRRIITGKLVLPPGEPNLSEKWFDGNWLRTVLRIPLAAIFIPLFVPFNFLYRLTQYSLDLGWRAITYAATQIWAGLSWIVSHIFTGIAATVSKPENGSTYDEVSQCLGVSSGKDSFVNTSDDEAFSENALVQEGKNGPQFSNAPQPQSDVPQQSGRKTLEEINKELKDGGLGPLDKPPIILEQGSIDLLDEITMHIKSQQQSPNLG